MSHPISLWLDERDTIGICPHAPFTSPLTISIANTWANPSFSASEARGGKGGRRVVRLLLQTFPFEKQKCKIRLKCCQFIFFKTRYIGTTGSFKALDVHRLFKYRLEFVMKFEFYRSYGFGSAGNRWMLFVITNSGLGIVYQLSFYEFSALNIAETEID